MASHALAQSSWKFRFDQNVTNRHTESTGLDVSFSRATNDTISPTGEFRSAGTSVTDNARFDRIMRLSPVPATVRVLAHEASLVLASGYDADDEEELMVYLSFDSNGNGKGELHVYHNSEDCEDVNVTELPTIAP